MKLKLIATAKRVGEYYDIPWTLLAAIAAIESAWGKRPVGKHNYTGMKRVPGMWKRSVTAQTTEYVNGNKMPATFEFAAYISMEACFCHLAETLLFSRHYRGLDTHDPEEYPALCSIYATDPLYHQKVSEIITLLEANPLLED